MASPVTLAVITFCAQIEFILLKKYNQLKYFFRSIWRCAVKKIILYHGSANSTGKAAAAEEEVRIYAEKAGRNIWS